MGEHDRNDPEQQFLKDPHSGLRNQQAHHRLPPCGALTKDHKLGSPCVLVHKERTTPLPQGTKFHEAHLPAVSRPAWQFWKSDHQGVNKVDSGRGFLFSSLGLHFP